MTGSAGEKLDLDVNLNALPASLANTFVPSLGADGAISGKVDVTGTSATPVVAYDLRWANAAIAQAKSAGVGALDVAAKGQFANNVVTLDTTLNGAGGLAFKAGGKVGITGNMPLDIKASGNLPLRPCRRPLGRTGASP